MSRLFRRFGRAFLEMPLVVKIALVWLVFIVGAAIYSRLDRVLGQALPLQDPFYQPFLFGEAKPVEGPVSYTHLTLPTILLV